MSMQKVNDVYIADTARIMGEVTLGKDVSLWYGVSVRGDIAPVSIGKGTNVQENAVIHVDAGVPNQIGENITIGHGAIIHGSKVGDGSLIGMGAVLLGGSVVGKNCLIAARALVTENANIPDNAVVMGIPGKVVRQVTDEQLEMMHANARHYVDVAKRHYENPDDITTRPWGKEPLAGR